MVALAYSLFRSIPSYPTAWQTVLALAAFVAGCYNLTLGYFVTVGVMAWPIWQLSPYLAALFLAIAIVAHRPILRHLPWAILIAAAPLSTDFLVAGLAPLVAGMFLGSGSSFVVGALAALWLKLAGGMAGQSTDMLTLLHYSVPVDGIITRFVGADSVTTLRLLIEPLNKDSTLLLLDLLQVIGWGLAGALISWLRYRAWNENKPWLSMTTALLYSTLALWGIVYVLPVALGLATFQMDGIDPWATLSVLLALPLTSGLYGLQIALSRPSQRERIRAPALRPIAPISADATTPPPPSPRPSGRPSTGKPSAEDDTTDDLIMIELD